MPKASVFDTTNFIHQIIAEILHSRRLLCHVPLTLGTGRTGATRFGNETLIEGRERARDGRKRSPMAHSNVISLGKEHPDTPLAHKQC